jgi:hypothetical protein
MKRTSLVFPKLNRLFKLELINIHLGVKAVIRLQNDSKVARAQINRAPRRNRLSSVDNSLHILQMLFAKALDRFALESR